MSSQRQIHRPERADKARNRARILAAASDAFAEMGADTQMDEIAARAGLGVGTLYRHFATKESLMAAMVQRKMEAILDVVRDVEEHGEGEPFDVFADALRRGAEVAAADAAARQALAPGGDIVLSKVSRVMEELESTMQILIDRAQAAGTLRADISAADIPMIMCGVSAVMPVPGWQWRRYLEIVLGGLRAEPAAGSSPGARR